MEKYIEYIRNFKRSEMILNGEFKESEFVLLMSDIEYGQIAHENNHFENKISADFDGELMRIDIKRLPMRQGFFRIIKKSELKELLDFQKRTVAYLVPKMLSTLESGL